MNILPPGISTIPSGHWGFVVGATCAADPAELGEAATALRSAELVTAAAGVPSGGSGGLLRSRKNNPAPSAAAIGASTNRIRDVFCGAPVPVVEPVTAPLATSGLGVAAMIP